MGTWLLSITQIVLQWCSVAHCHLYEHLIASHTCTEMSHEHESTKQDSSRGCSALCVAYAKQSEVHLREVRKNSDRF